MANQDEEMENKDAVETVDGVALSSGHDGPSGHDGFSDPGGAVTTGPAQLGVTRYVHVAFLAVGVTTAYVAGKVLEAAWNSLASWPTATRYVSWLVRFREDERPAFTMTAGLVFGVLFGFWMYRKPSVRQWADDVASELAKVHWPNRELVQNGTVVVVVAGLFATVYVGLLDRLWVFVTTLVYGA